MLEADADFVESQVQTAQNLARSDVFGALRITDTMLKNLPLKECDVTRVQRAHKCFEVGLWRQFNSTGGFDGFYYNCYVLYHYHDHYYFLQELQRNALK